MRVREISHLPQEERQEGALLHVDVVAFEAFILGQMS